MGFMVWHALETPKRTLSYQGYSYGLVRACVGLPDPTPNPGWPDPGDVNNDYSSFNDAIAKAKSDLGNVKFKNRFLLEIAKNGPAAVLVAVWNAIIPDDDHLLRMLHLGMARRHAGLSHRGIVPGASCSPFPASN